MTLHIIGIDQDPDSAQPSPQSLLRAAKACSATAGSKSQLLQKLDALKSILPVQKTGTHEGLPFKLLDSIRDDAERLTSGDSLADQFWANAENLLIDIVNVRSSIGQAIHAVIAAGGDIEIAAHNEPGRISLTLVEPSGLRKVLFNNKSHPITHQNAA